MRADDFSEEFDDDQSEEDSALDGESAASQGYKNYMTPVGLKMLKDEYHQLFHNERPKLVETVSWAASNGDRSENGDYIYGKRRLREIDRRLKYLNRRLSSAVIVDPTTQAGDVVLFGARVTVEDEDGKKLLYHIVGEDEIDIAKRKISWVSPVAKALMNARVGDVVVVQRPNGEAELTILKVEFKGEA
jgi:transcription elongation factor GreB